MEYRILPESTLGLGWTRLVPYRTVPHPYRGGPWGTHESRETQMSHSFCAHVIIADLYFNQGCNICRHGQVAGAVAQNDGRRRAGIGGRGRGRSWSFARVFTGKGRGGLGSLLLLLPSASKLACCGQGRGVKGRPEWEEEGRRRPAPRHQHAFTVHVHMHIQT